MVTLQEYLNQKYPTREDKENVKEIMVAVSCPLLEVEGGELDLNEYVNLEMIYIWGNYLKTPLKKISISNCSQLVRIDLCDNEFADTNFLNQVSNPQKLNTIEIFNNNIQFSNIDIFTPFINLERLKIGSMKRSLNKGKRNRFYGSFESWKDLTKLYSICIEATDVSEGLEYLPATLKNFNCSPFVDSAKCSQIQDQLRPYNYDINAWQLAHPHLMYRARPELFELPESREKWLNAIVTKIEKSQTKLQEIKQNEPDKVKRIKRLEQKINNLNLIKKLMEERSIFEDSLKTGVKWYDRFKVDKSTQTDLTSKEVETALEIQEQVKILAKK